MDHVVTAAESCADAAPVVVGALMSSGATKSGTDPLNDVWSTISPVVDACLDPSPAGSIVVARTSLAEHHARLYTLCMFRSAAGCPSQSQCVYALLRAQLHVHTQAVARVLAEALHLPSHIPTPYPMHLVDQEHVSTRTEYLRRALGTSTYSSSDKQSSVESSDLARNASESSVLEMGASSRSSVVQIALNFYARCWRAYTAGIDNIASLFLYLDRVSIPLGLHGNDEDDILALGPNNVAVHDIRTTALLAWRHQVLSPLDSYISHAVLSAIACEREQRSCRTANTERSRARADMFSSPRDHSFRSDEAATAESGNEPSPDLMLIDPVVQSLCEVCRTSATCSNNVSSFFGAHDGLPSTALSGLSPSATFADPLRTPAVEQEATQLSLYRSLFETSFLSEVHDFYFEKSKVMLATHMSVRDYIRTVGDLIQTEIDLVSSYGNPSTIKPLSQVLEQTLIANHAEALHEEADSMLRDSAVKELKSLYYLLLRIPGSVIPVHSLLRTHVVNCGLAAVRPWASYDAHAPQLQESWQDHLSKLSHECAAVLNNGSIANESPVDCCLFLSDSAACAFVSSAWLVYDRFLTMTRMAFESDKEFTNALEQGCERFLNSVQAAPELLAQFCHEILEKPICLGSADLDSSCGGCGRSSSANTPTLSSHLSEENSIAWLTRVTRLFRFLNDSDTFQSVYAMKLTRRLVYRTSVSHVLEEAMLTLLRDTCGCDYTSRLLRMFTDVSASADETVAFQEARLNGKICPCHESDNGIVVDALVLSSSAWTFLAQRATETSSRLLELNTAVHPATGSRCRESIVDAATGARIDSRRISSLGRSAEDNRGSLRSWSEAPAVGGACVEMKLQSAPPNNGSDTSPAVWEDLALRALAVLPARITRLSESFVEFYSHSKPRHEERKLRWLYHMSRLEIEARIGGDHQIKTVRIEASLPQAAVLMHFNDHDIVSMRDLCSCMGLTLSEMEPIVGVLVNAGLLQGEEYETNSSESNNRDAAVLSDTLNLNLDSLISVNNSAKKCRCCKGGQTPLALLSYESNHRSYVKRDNTAIDTDRRQQLKACIVRVMKQRRRAEEADLVRQVSEDMSKWFLPRESDVIGSIASLVDNEYIAYEDGVCVYVA